MTTLSLEALLSVSEMRAAERATIAASTGGFTLMQRAGKAVAQQILNRFSPQPTLVMCGPGNNGGDGFIAAQALLDAGWDIKVGFLGDKENLPEECSQAQAAYKGRMEPLTPALVEGHTLVVDALYGLGLNRPIEGSVKEVLEEVVRRKANVVAVDIPSGINGTSGAMMGYALPASLTVTFHRKKLGHALQPGKNYSGEIVVVDIGIGPQSIDPARVTCWENDPSLWAHSLRWPSYSTHKYRRGHVLVQGGPLAQTGASRLAARAALRVAAGLVSLVCEPETLPIYATNMMAVMTKPVTSDAEFQTLLADARITAVLIGPGAGVTEATKTRVLTACDNRVGLVLDADALSVFAGKHIPLFTKLGERYAKAIPCVMTPHEGEFTRLFAGLMGEQPDKLAAARKAATLSHSVIVLKGADTVIAAPDGRAIINTIPAPFLATAGSGDVLAGMITGLLATKMDPFYAAAASVWMHSMAGARFGAGLIAEDLPELLPEILQFLNLKSTV